MQGIVISCCQVILHRCSFPAALGFRMLCHTYNGCHTQTGRAPVKGNSVLYAPCLIFPEDPHLDFSPQVGVGYRSLITPQGVLQGQQRISQAKLRPLSGMNFQLVYAGINTHVASKYIFIYSLHLYVCIYIYIYIANDTKHAKGGGVALVLTLH